MVPLEIPESALHLLYGILTEMSQGNAVALNSIHAALTTEQAAAVLNVSTFYLESLLADKQIPVHTVGVHRQILLADLVEYKKRSDAEREAALDELVALGQEIGEGF